MRGGASTADLDDLNLALLNETDDWENLERAPESQTQQPPETEHAPQQAGVILVSHLFKLNSIEMQRLMDHAGDFGRESTTSSS